MTGGNPAALIKCGSECDKTVRASMAPWKCRDATSVTGVVMGVRGWNSSKTLEERSLWSCKGKSCLEGAQETAGKLR